MSHGLMENIARLREQLRQASGGRDIMLLPVTKSRTPQEILPLAQAGLLDIGENRVQEYIEKRPFLEKFRFHMIGQLQTNKVRVIIDDVCLIHSVDRLRLAQEIQRQAQKAERRVDVLAQVNIAGEQQKAGISPADLPNLLEGIAQLPNLRLRGLMTIAPLSRDPQEARPVFAQARRLFEGISHLPDVDILSMGMSADCLVAAEEGATMVRVGSALFDSQ